MKLQHQLKETIERLKHAQPIAKIGNWVLDLHTGVMTWSEEARRIYALPSGQTESTYQEWESFVHPDDLAIVRSRIHDSRNSLTDFSLSHRIVRRDGEVRELFAEIKCHLDSERRTMGLSCIVHDVTEMIQIKRSLSRTEENISLIMDLIPLSIYARDAAGNYLWGNQVFLNHYGLTADMLHGKNMRDLVRTEEEFIELSRQDAEVLNSDEKLFVSEFSQKNSEGELTTWRIIKVPFTPEGFTQKAVLGIAEDITIRKNYENDLLSLTEKLTKRNKELEQFSQMVSHDLRGPLATLMGVTDMIDNVKLDQEEVATFLSGTKEALLKLDNIVRTMNHILDPRKQNQTV